MRSLWLAIDATSPNASAALAADGRLLAHSISPARGGRSLLALVDDVFREAGKSREEELAVVAIQGPGSFTGVRITLATAMGLAPASSGSGTGLFGLSSLAALAIQAPPGTAKVRARIDALRGELFVQEFSLSTAKLVALTDPERVALTDDAASSDGTLVEFDAGFPHRETPGPRSDSAAAALTVPALAPAVAQAASSGVLDGLLVANPAPLYLRSAAVTISARSAR